MTGINGQPRTNDKATDGPMQVRYGQKMSKYGRIAERNNLRFIPAIFFHPGQFHGEFKRLVKVKKQIRHKLIYLEGEAKKGKSKIYDEVAIKMYIYAYNQNGWQKCGVQSGWGE